MFRKMLVILILLALAIPTVGQTARAADPVKIKLWHMEQPPQRVQRIQQLMDEFNASQSEVSISQEPQSWGEVYTKAPAAAQAGNLPEILFAIPDFTMAVAPTGAVQPVTKLMDQLKKNHEFSKAAVEPYTYNGEVWAVPLYGMVQSLWYNVDMFKKANVKPPTTWAELLAAAKALHNPEKGVYGIGLPANKQLYTDQVLYNFMVTAGAAEIFNKDGSLRFDNPETVKAFDMYNQLWQYSPPDSVNWTWGEAEAAFAAGTVPMIFQFTVISTYDTQVKGAAENLGVLPIPVADGGKPGAIFYSNAAMITTKDPAKQEAAGKFLTWLLEEKNYGRFLNMEPGLFLPVTADTAKAGSSFWKDPLAVKYQKQIETMVKNEEGGALFGFTGGNVFPAIGQISAQNLLAQTVQKMIVDKQKPADAVKWGQEQMIAAAKAATK